MGADTAKNRALCRLFSKAVNEPLFSQLRTKEQLGYIVSCQLHRLHGVVGWILFVQSTKFAVTVLEERTELFLAAFAQSNSPLLRLIAATEEVSETSKLQEGREMLDKIRKSLIGMLQVAPKKQSELLERWAAQLTSQALDFEAIEREVKELEQLTLEDVAAFYRDYIHPAGCKRARMCFRVHPFVASEVQLTATTAAECKSDDSPICPSAAAVGASAICATTMASAASASGGDTSRGSATASSESGGFSVLVSVDSTVIVSPGSASSVTLSTPVPVLVQALPTKDNRTIVSVPAAASDLAAWKRQQMVHPPYLQFLT